MIVLPLGRLAIPWLTLSSIFHCSDTLSLSNSPLLRERGPKRASYRSLDTADAADGLARRLPRRWNAEPEPLHQTGYYYTVYAAGVGGIDQRLETDRHEKFDSCGLWVEMDTGKGVFLLADPNTLRWREITRVPIEKHSSIPMGNIDARRWGDARTKVLGQTLRKPRRYNAAWCRARARGAVELWKGSHLLDLGSGVKTGIGAGVAGGVLVAATVGGAIGAAAHGLRSARRPPAEGHGHQQGIELVDTALRSNSYSRIAEGVPMSHFTVMGRPAGEAVGSPVPGERRTPDPEPGRS